MEPLWTDAARGVRKLGHLSSKIHQYQILVFQLYTNLPSDSSTALESLLCRIAPH
jgi:hypothetical protein